MESSMRESACAYRRGFTVAKFSTLDMPWSGRVSFLRMARDVRSPNGILRVGDAKALSLLLFQLPFPAV